MTKEERLLVVEDEPTSRQLLAAFMKNLGFQVATAENAAMARLVMKSEPIDLVLLDIRLPDEDGITLAEEFNEHYSAPIIFVTQLDKDQDKIKGLKLGADYITKPYNPDELHQRTRNALDNANGRNSSGSQDDDVIEFIGYKLDIGRHILTLPNDQIQDLTSGEFAVLKELLLAKGRVRSREQLLRAVNPLEEPDSSDRTIDVLISRLRQKLKVDGKDPGVILTVKGHGYRLNING